MNYEKIAGQLAEKYDMRHAKPYGFSWKGTVRILIGCLHLQSALFPSTWKVYGCTARHQRNLFKAFVELCQKQGDQP